MNSAHTQLDLRHVRMLVAIDAHGSLTGAAKQLGVTQSALSHVIRGFQETTGVALCAKRKNRMQLTPEARRLLPVARDILSGMERMQLSLSGEALARRRELRVSTECYTCYGWLPDVVRGFESEFPGVSVKVILDATHDASQALADGRIDVAITHPDNVGPGQRSRWLFRDEVVAVCASDHPLASLKRVTSQQLARERLLLYGELESSYLYRLAFRQLGLRPSAISTLPLTEGLLEMARAGLGVAAVPRWTVGGAQVRQGLRAVRIDRGLFRDWVAASMESRWIPFFDEFATLAARSFQKLIRRCPGALEGARLLTASGAAAGGRSKSPKRS